MLLAKLIQHRCQELVINSNGMKIFVYIIGFVTQQNTVSSRRLLTALNFVQNKFQLVNE